MMDLEKIATHEDELNISPDIDIAYYAGSRAFSWVSHLSGLRIDQVNFLLSQFGTLFLGFVLRVYLHPKNVSSQVRLLFSGSVGLAVLYFCFGYHILHVLFQALTCYIILKNVSPHSFQRFVLTFAVGYLSLVHILRLIYNYGSYTLDITGPLMVTTQKVTSLAFSLHDGLTKKDNLNEDQKKQMIKRSPTFLEYMCYCFSFQGLMCGPMIFYNDYMQYIEGNRYVYVKQTDLEKSNGNIKEFDNEPCPNRIVLKKVVHSLIYALILLTCIPMFPIQRALDESFLTEWSFISKTLFLIAATTLVRTKYYHAWLLADAVCNMSGLGFTGYNGKGEATWDGVSNVDPIGFEMGLSLKGCLDHWNRGTGLWLRRVAYDRSPYLRTVATYSLSALWHGFYPGYYLTFMTGALITVTSRNCRRKIRPHFQSSPQMAFYYDIITFIVTKIAMAYTTFPFVMLEFWASVREIGRAHV